MELDPLNYFNQYNLGLFYWMLKDYGNAEEQFQIFLLHYPNSQSIHSHMASVYLGQGDKNKALREIEKEPNTFRKLNAKSMVVYAAGNKTEADSLLMQFIEDWEEGNWIDIAFVYAFRGERDGAFKWLELAYDNKDPALFEILNYPEFESLWGDPRWNKFINKLGLPKDHGFHRD